MRGNINYTPPVVYSILWIPQSGVRCGAILLNSRGLFCIIYFTAYISPCPRARRGLDRSDFGQAEATVSWLGAPHAHGACRTWACGSAPRPARAFSTTPNARSPVVGVDAARSRRRRFHCVLCNKRRTNQEPRRHVPNCLCRVSTLPLPHYNLYTILRGSRVPLNYIITSCDCTFSPPYAASHPWCCCFGPCPWGPCPCWPCSCAPRPWCRSSSAGRPP